MHEIVQLIIINNSRVGFFDLRNKNISLTIIIDIKDYVSENENNFYYISDSQFKDQRPSLSIDTNFNDTIDENNNALNNSTSLNENRRFENLMLI